MTKILSTTEWRMSTAIKIRPPALDETSVFFKILRAIIADWARNPEKIIEQTRYSCGDTPAVFVCVWPEMEKRLFDTFIARRKLGRLVRDGQFRHNATNLWKQTYTELHVADSSSKLELFVFSQGWFIASPGYLTVYYEHDTVTFE
jgi:hypothetical protein